MGKAPGACTDDPQRVDDLSAGNQRCDGTPVFSGEKFCAVLRAAQDKGDAQDFAAFRQPGKVKIQEVPTGEYVWVFPPDVLDKTSEQGGFVPVEYHSGFFRSAGGCFFQRRRQRIGLVFRRKQYPHRAGERAEARIREGGTHCPDSVGYGISFNVN